MYVQPMCRTTHSLCVALLHQQYCKCTASVLHLHVYCHPCATQTPVRFQLCARMPGRTPSKGLHAHINTRARGHVYCTIYSVIHCPYLLSYCPYAHVLPVLDAVHVSGHGTCLSGLCMLAAWRRFRTPVKGAREGQSVRNPRQTRHAQTLCERTAQRPECAMQAAWQIRSQHHQGPSARARAAAGAGETSAAYTTTLALDKAWPQCCSARHPPLPPRQQ